MKCEHGNEITVLIELYANSYESFMVSRYNAQGVWYNPPGQRKSKYIWLLIKRCPQCKTIKFEEK